MDIEQIMRATPVIPVLVIDDPDDAVPLARALLEGGLKVLEITLRTDSAMQSIERIQSELSEVIVGAGTVNNTAQLQQCADAGVDFIVSPGFYTPLASAAREAKIPYLPGVSSASEVLAATSEGWHCLKFFPASAAGGIDMLRALGGPFQSTRFCPTGGIHADNLKRWLELDNVLCVGGSWVAPNKLIQSGDWQAITTLAAACSR